MAYPIAAQATVDISLKLDANFGRNSNLFRVDRQGNLPADNEGTGPATPLLKSAVQSQSVDIGVGFPLGSERTRLILTSTLGRTSYSAKQDLNHSPRALTATLPWRFSDVLEGELSAGSNRTAYAFDDFYPLLDITKRTWTQALVSYLVTPTLSIPLNFSRQTLQHQDRATHVFLDSTSQRIGASVMHRTPTGSTLQGGLARTETQYPGRATNVAGNVPRDTYTDVFVDVNWAYSPITQFSMRWANRQRAFDGNVNSTRTNLYRLGIAHSFSQQLQLDAQLWRLPANSTQSGVADGTSTGRRIGLRYAPHEKWDVGAAWQKQSERNQVFGNESGVTPFNPDTTNITFRARYHIEPRLSAYIDVATEKRVRRQTQSASQQVLRVGLEYKFENIPGAAVRNRAASLPLF